MSYRIIQGDATSAKPEEGREVVIAHVCNNVGAWGAGFVMALSKKWKEPEKAYRQWCTEGEFKEGNGLTGVDDRTFKIGNVQIVEVEEGIKVCNMVAQDSVGMRYEPYDSTVLLKKAETANIVLRVGMPKSSRYAPVSYESIYDGLAKLAKYAKESNARVVMPMIGSSLAGGDWNFIEEIIKVALDGVDTTVYEFVSK